MSDMNSSDHDLLVRLDTKLEVVMRQQNDFIERYETRHTALVARVTALEASDSKDSEKFRAITDEVRRSLNNSDRIQGLEAKTASIENTVKSVAGTSRLWDILIAVGATASFLANIFLK